MKITVSSTNRFQVDQAFSVWKANLLSGELCARLERLSATVTRASQASESWAILVLMPPQGVWGVGGREDQSDFCCSSLVALVSVAAARLFAGSAGLLVFT